MKFLPLLMMAFGALVIGCERHDFEDTKKLHDRSAPVSVDEVDEEEQDGDS